VNHEFVKSKQIGQTPRKREMSMKERRPSPLHAKPVSLVADGNQAAALPVVVLHHGDRLAPKLRIPSLLQGLRTPESLDSNKKNQIKGWHQRSASQCKRCGGRHVCLRAGWWKTKLRRMGRRRSGGTGTPEGGLARAGEERSATISDCLQYWERDPLQSSVARRGTVLHLHGLRSRRSRATY
jgi:hypothetical protein